MKFPLVSRKRLDFALDLAAEAGTRAVSLDAKLQFAATENLAFRKQLANRMGMSTLDEVALLERADGLQRCAVIVNQLREIVGGSDLSDMSYAEVGDLFEEILELLR